MSEIARESLADVRATDRGRQLIACRAIDRRHNVDRHVEDASAPTPSRLRGRRDSRDFGENRVQEAAPKIAELRSRGVTPRWHLVGHLQRNKVAAAIEPL